MLAKQAPAPPPPEVTESSSLIDIATMSGGGAFAPLFAPPVTFAPAVSEETARRGNGPVVVGAMALAFVAMVSVGAFASVRARSSAPSTRAVAASPAVLAPAADPPSAGIAPTIASAMPSSDAPPASTSPLAVTPAKTGKPSNVAPPARSAAPAPTAVAASAATKCCPGESEMACHMRVAAGASCSVEPPVSAVTTASPFDRAAAARALGINVASCKRGDGPTGAGHVKVTFQPSGSVSAVDVEPPYAGTATGACVAQRYRGVSVPAFSGSALTVGKSFAID